LEIIVLEKNYNDVKNIFKVVFSIIGKYYAFDFVNSVAVESNVSLKFDEFKKDLILIIISNLENAKNKFKEKENGNFEIIGKFLNKFLNNYDVAECFGELVDFCIFDLNLVDYINDITEILFLKAKNKN
jgi:hypothetical protein